MAIKQALIAQFSAALITGAGSTLTADKPETVKSGTSMSGGDSIGLPTAS